MPTEKAIQPPGTDEGTRLNSDGGASSLPFGSTRVLEHEIAALDHLSECELLTRGSATQILQI